MQLTRLKEESAQNESETVSSKTSKFVSIKQFMSKNIGTNLFVISMAVILLGGLGGLIFLNYFVNPKQNPVSLLNYQAVTSKPVSLTLNLSSPDDNLLVFDSNMLVSGQTAPNVLILVTVNDTNQILNASKQGDFSLTVKLAPGANQLIVSVFDANGNYKSEYRSIYYSEEKI